MSYHNKPSSSKLSSQQSSLATTTPPQHPKRNNRTFMNYSSSQSNKPRQMNNPLSNLNCLKFDYDGNNEEEEEDIHKRIKLNHPQKIPTSEEYYNLILNKDPNKFQYCFGTECTSGFFGTLATDISKTNIHCMENKIPWEEARFLIEKKHGLFTINQQRKAVTGAYIEGYFWTAGLKNWRKDAQIVPPTHIMTAHDQIIVIRKPSEKGVPHYVPARFKHEVENVERHNLSIENKEKEDKIVQHLNLIKPSTLQFTDTMTEEEKINLLINSTAEKTQHEQLQQQLLKPIRHQNYAQYHPSDIKNNPSIVKPPPPSYTCHRCHQKGHWKQYCTTLADGNFVPTPQYKLPKGIPKTMLKEAQNDEEKKSAMRTIEGKYVLRAENAYNAPSFITAPYSGSSYSDVPADVEHVEEEEEIYYY